MFSLTYGVMRNDLFVFNIIILTADCWQKKNFNRNDHSLSFAFTRYLLLPFIVTLFCTRCLVAILRTTRYHSLSLDLSLVCPVINDSRKASIDQKKIFACALQSNALTKLKIFHENVDPCFS